MTRTTLSEPIQFLQRELQRRQDRNAGYSLRRFADRLGVSPGWLSHVLAGQKQMSVAMAEKIFGQLCENETEKKRLVIIVAHGQVKRGLKRTDPKARLLSRKAAVALANSSYDEMDSWYYSALLELISIEDFQYDFDWIARELGLTPFQAKTAAERLLRMGLVKAQNGTLTRAPAHLSSENKRQSSASLRKIQRELREKSIDAIESVELAKRSHTHIAMAIDPSRLAEAKKKIQSFQRELCEFLEGGKKKSVYIMEIGLFPAQTSERNLKSASNFSTEKKESAV